jgi:protease-4
MIDDSAKASLIPHLISILKGNDIKEVKSEIPTLYMEWDGEEEIWVAPEMNANSQYINVLSIKTALYKYDQMCGPIGTRSMTKILKEWEANDNIIGVVLDIDCPGGQVSGLAEFANFIYNYSKPIVSYSDGLVASGGLYVSAASKYCVVNQYADFIGSLGTMLTYVDLEGILIKDGAVIKDIYATGSPRKNEETRLMKNEGSDALFIKNIIDPAREQFRSDMTMYRPGMDPEVFEGAIYKPVEAVSKGLFDQIGTIKDAFDKVIELSNSKKSNKSNSNTNTNTMQTKQLPKLQAVLGLTTALAITDNGSYLNAEQLDNLESRLEAFETSEATLQTQLTEAQNNTVLQTELTAATGTITGLEASVDAILVEAGLTATGNVTEKLTSLSAKVKEMAGKDGANHTAIRVDGKQPEGTKQYVDANAGHNKLANSINQ